MTFRGYAIIVTVDENVDSEYPNLGPNVVADGDALVAVLSDEELCGYGADRITRLSGKAATAQAILAAMKRLEMTLAPEDPVLFYYSGHGDPPHSGSLGASLLVPYDFETSGLRNGLSGADLGAAWQAIPSMRKLAIIDACYAGGLGLAKAAQKAGLSVNVLDRLASGRGSVALASSRSTETSVILHRDRLSLFTKHLVGGLTGGAGHDKDGYIRVFDLFTHVATEVRKQHPQQHPVYAAAHQEDNFPVSFCMAPARRKARVATVTGGAPNDVKQLTQLFSVLYPLGPIDQSIWERAGGEVSRIVITQQGRTDWFRALQLLEKGGGGASIRMATLIAEALADYPHYSELEQLQPSYGGVS